MSVRTPSVPRCLIVTPLRCVIVVVGNEFRECDSQSHAHLFTDADSSDYSPKLFYDAFNAAFEEPLSPQVDMRARTVS